MDSPRLRVTELRRRFGQRAALDGVSFEVRPGEIFGLLGPNGAGKTTAFRVLSGLLPADGGSIQVDGQPTSPQARGYRARLGVVFQDPSIDLKLTGRENLRLGAALYGVSRVRATEAIDNSLRLMELGPRADELASTYSGGMRRRIEIARVLLHDPSLLLLDEPGRGVDPEALRRIWEQMQLLRRSRAVSLIVTTHQPEEAEHCDRIALLDQGKVVATGTPDELRAQVAGDVISVRGDDPAAIAASIAQHLALPARVVADQVIVEAPRGPEIIPRIAELFPQGRLHSIATARPTLADVFAKLTGKGLAA